MIRVLIFFLGLVLIAGAITYLATVDSRITGEAFGQQFDGPSGIILGALFLAFLAVIYITHKTKDIMGMPARMRAREKEAKRARGVAALTRGLEAVAVGDAGDAAHHAKVAQRHLDDLALTRLLTAQAAQLNGDEAAATKCYSAMLEAPETEFLGLKGLYLQARAAGDRATALQHAERAYSLRPNAQWAFQSVFELSLEDGAWRRAREAIEKGARNNLVDAEKADRAKAALLTADAYASDAAGDHAAALADADAALKLAPAFTPAAALAAERLDADGKKAKAAKTIEAAFSRAPHPALSRIYDRLYKAEPAPKRADRLRKLAALNAGSREATHLTAYAHILQSEWREAMTALERQLTDNPTTQDYALMASAASGRDGESAGRVWFERAARAPRDARPGAEGVFQFTKEGWAQLVREYMERARLAAPPAVVENASISKEEIKLLTAPPALPIADATSEAGKGEDADDPDAGSSDEGRPRAIQPELAAAKPDAPDKDQSASEKSAEAAKPANGGEARSAESDAPVDRPAASKTQAADAVPPLAEKAPVESPSGDDQPSDDEKPDETKSGADSVPAAKR